MKRSTLLRHPSAGSGQALRRHGCYLKRQGRAHSLWCNPATGAIEAVPRHSEIANKLARKICRNLSVPEIGG